MRVGLFSFLILTNLFVFTGNNAKAQQYDADSIVNLVQNKFREIQDYEAEVSIKLDVDFIRIPVKYGTIWFMQPDKVEVKTKGFSLLPKRGMNFSPGYLFNGSFTSLYVKMSEINNIPAHMIKIIPQNEDNEIIIATLWIDVKRKVVLKMEATTRNEGTFQMTFNYPAEKSKYELPETIIFQFDIRKNELPLGLTGDFETINVKDDSPKSRKGKVTINYLKYIVNEGRAKAIFDAKRKSK